MRDVTALRSRGARGAKAAAALLALALLAACAASEPIAANQAPPQPAAVPPPPPPPSPPPVDLAGRWKLSAAGGEHCFMNFGNSPGAIQGTIAPEGGCPDNFFTSRKWTFEHAALIIRNHKGESLAHLSFAGDHFDGQATNGTQLTLSR